MSSACSTAALQQQTIEASSESAFDTISLELELGDDIDIKYVDRRFNKAIQGHGVNNSGSEVLANSRAAVLQVEEIDRHQEPVVRHKNMGRSSLTMMRGREVRERPVITVRATLVDAQSQQSVFEADYVLQGQWYMDSTELVGALADTLLKQLEREGFIAY